MKRAFLLFLSLFFLAAFVRASPRIRVALALAVPHLHVSSSAGLAVCLAGGKRIFSGSSVDFDASGERLLVNGRAVYAASVVVYSRGPFKLDKKNYRGLLEVRLDSGELEAINFVPLEEYLYSVVGSEMPARWPLEALKAQAVVARTYGVKKIKERKAFSYDVLASTQDQAYDGIENETPSTKQAVRETRGLVVTYQGKLITAYYHSDCGGKTENGNNVFKGDFPYLKSVVCPFDKDSPYQSWSKTLTLSEISRDVGKRVTNLSARVDPSTRHVESVLLDTAEGSVSISGHLFRKLIGLREIRSTHFTIEPVERVVYVPRTKEVPMAKVVEYASQRVAVTRSSDKVEGLSGSAFYLMDESGSLSAAAVSRENPVIVLSGKGMLSVVYRHLAALFRQTRILFKRIVYPKVVKEKMGKKVTWVPVKVPAAFTFVGSGWGHGVGLCQWGARGMALSGKTYREILHYYYSGVQIEKNY